MVKALDKSETDVPEHIIKLPEHSIPNSELYNFVKQIIYINFTALNIKIDFLTTYLLEKNNQNMKK